MAVNKFNDAAVLRYDVQPATFGICNYMVDAVHLDYDEEDCVEVEWYVRRAVLNSIELTRLVNNLYTPIVIKEGSVSWARQTEQLFIQRGFKNVTIE